MCETAVWNMPERDRHIEVPAALNGFMQRALTAIVLVALMVFSGCLSILNPTEDDVNEDVDNMEDVVIQPQWRLREAAQGSIAPGDFVSVYVDGLLPDDSKRVEVEMLRVVRDDGLGLDLEQAFVWTPAPAFAFVAPSSGTYELQTTVSAKEGYALSTGDGLTLSHTLTVVQGGLRFNLPATIYEENEHLAASGTIQAPPGRTSEDLARLSCSVVVDLGEERSVLALSLGTDFGFDLSTASANVESSVLFRAVCVGPVDTLVLEQRVAVVFDAQGEDMDGDGVPDEQDACQAGVGAAEGWASSPSSDVDGDGCRDMDEDMDDDNDGVDDAADGCASTVGWVSSPSNDHDADGCDDMIDDEDDDGDGRPDSEDQCPRGHLGWYSHPTTDWDQDGCRDSDEDVDDDNDAVLDVDDACPLGQTGWWPTSGTDWDEDGCRDADEDEDDDADGVNDVHLNGTEMDQCPYTPRNETADASGCGPSQRDADGDGVTDNLDLCEATDPAHAVDAKGCEDRDQDGVHRNDDECPNSPQRWTIDSSGCSVLQTPVPWTSASTLSGPMQAVPDFTVATLNGSFSFSDVWDGRSTFLFLIMKTTSQGSTSSTFTMNPGTLIRSLPDDVHLVYGSVDASYHQQVIDRKTDVERRLTPAEQSSWEPRIHYLDIDLSGAPGGLGDALDALGEPAGFGIDRWQRLRQMGSTYTWNTASTSYDPFHYAHEAWMWTTEFPAEVRRNDPGIESVDLMLSDQHQGGWSSGFTSSMDVQFNLTHDLSTYDTLEIFHEHACSERRDRYQTSSGGYAGCHEWDYEANLRICNRDNTSSCGTEFARWITTYGREGRWLTDVTPYLFMLEDGDDRRFQYKGANGGSLTITFLFSRWSGEGEGHRPDTATFGFTGGQFNGSYNDPALYERSRVLDVPANASRVRIVATITGHGFQVDDANCAEFCDHEHHFSIGSNSAYEWHPIVYSSTGCEDSIRDGVVANQFGSWPYGRAGWCAGMDVKQWTYDITSWVTPGQSSTLEYRGLFNGAEYQPTGETTQTGRRIHAEIWVVYDVDLPERS